MNQRTVTILYALHSWAGITTGLLMFIVCFSGAVVVFKHEIDRWANPTLSTLPRSAKPAGVDAVVASVRDRYIGARLEFIVLPNDVNPNYFVFIREAGSEEGAARAKLVARSDTGEVVGKVDSQLGQFVRNLHVFLFFGPRWIVGFLGAAMLVLIGTGIFIHRKILAELFTLRWGRSFRLITSDLHRAAGIWGLLFHIVIAFTGAWLGLAPVFTQGYAFAVGAAPSEEQALNKAVNKAPAPMQSVDALLIESARLIPGFEPTSVSLQRFGRSDAVVSVSGGLADHLAANARIAFSGADGAVKFKQDPRERGFWSQFNGLMEPLHFGDFGGVVLKWLYFILGLSPALLSLSGTLIWIDRRKHKQRILASSVPSSAAIGHV